MADDLAARLARVANNHTLQLVHKGRKSGKSYEVTIWFLVEGATLYLVTASLQRQWPRNLGVNPGVTLKIADQTFTGKAEQITDESGRAHVTDLVGRKYWYALPYIRVFRMLANAGLVKDRSGSFRVRLDGAVAS